MAITITDSVKEPRSFSIGPVKCQIVTFRALSGATSGTVTADELSRLDHILFDCNLKHSAAPTFATNVATLAFVVPAETAAAKTIANITYTAVADQGQDGNSITIAIVDGTGDTPAVTAGNETVSVSGLAISVHIDPTLVIGSTKQNVVDALTASAAASALISAAVAAGHETDVCPVASATALLGGVTGGARGTALCIGA